MSKFKAWAALTAVAATAAGVLMGSPAFAAGFHLPRGPHPAPLTVNYVGLHQTQTGTDELVVKVSNLVVPTNGSRPYTMNFDLSGATFGIQSSFTESVAAGAPNYVTWFVPLNVSTGTPLSSLSLSQAHLGLNEWNYNVKPSQELAVGGIGPLGALPYGQLPEVPWAAGLPLLIIGAGALWWRRSMAARLV